MSKKSRTEKRSKSGAQTSCPHCGKLLRGEKGMKMHIAEQHASGSQKAKAGGE
jgi:uncharacterized C2H2 Zn-finger protein